MIVMGLPYLSSTRLSLFQAGEIQHRSWEREEIYSYGKGWRRGFSRADFAEWAGKKGCDRYSQVSLPLSMIRPRHGEDVWKKGAKPLQTSHIFFQLCFAFQTSRFLVN